MNEDKLRAVVTDDLEVPESAHYLGLHIIATGDGTYHIQVDGHAGSVDSIESDDFDSVLELVDHCNSLHQLLIEYVYEEDDMDALIDWAGEMMTADPDTAIDNPDHYVFTGDPEVLEDRIDERTEEADDGDDDV